MLAKKLVKKSKSLKNWEVGQYLKWTEIWKKKEIKKLAIHKYWENILKVLKYETDKVFGTQKVFVKWKFYKYILR